MSNILPKAGKAVSSMTMKLHARCLMSFHGATSPISKKKYYPKYLIKQNLILKPTSEKKNNVYLSKINENIFLKRNFCSISQLICWNCENKISKNEEFCPKCNLIQKFNNEIDHFTRLNIERKININTKKLTKEFRKLQSKFHPDKFSLKSEVIYLIRV